MARPEPRDPEASHSEPDGRKKPEPVREILYDRVTGRTQEASIRQPDPGDPASSPRSLAEAFLEDHRHLTQGLSGTLTALEQGELTTAMRMADELDRRAGPHIRFEEAYFYPEVGRSRGPAYVSQLLREHDAGRQAVRALVDRPAGRQLTDDERSRITAGLREALDHAVSCGTLLSHVTTLDAEKQQCLLNTLLRLRDEGGRWTAHVAPEDAQTG